MRRTQGRDAVGWAGCPERTLPRQEATSSRPSTVVWPSRLPPAQIALTLSAERGHSSLILFISGFLPGSLSSCVLASRV